MYSRSSNVFEPGSKLKHDICACAHQIIIYYLILALPRQVFNELHPDHDLTFRFYFSRTDLYLRSVNVADSKNGICACALHIMNYYVIFGALRWSKLSLELFQGHWSQTPSLFFTLACHLINIVKLSATIFSLKNEFFSFCCRKYSYSYSVMLFVR